MAKRLFVLFRCGTRNSWWLKISDVDALADYQAAHADKYGRALLNIVRDRDSGMHGPCPREIPLSQAAYYRAVNTDASPVSALMSISSETTAAQLDALHEHGALYFNPAGGWNWGPPGEPVQTAWRDGFAFPSFTKDDIKITRFPDGTHYYAHIGDMEVRDGDVIKWPTRQEAYERALACLAED